MSADLRIACRLAVVQSLTPLLALFEVFHVWFIWMDGITADLVYRLRNEGVAVYTNKVTTSRGEKTFAYRLGTPSESFVKNLESRHIARARKTLYRNAISVSMAA